MLLLAKKPWDDFLFLITHYRELGSMTSLSFSVILLLFVTVQGSKMDGFHADNPSSTADEVRFQSAFSFRFDEHEYEDFLSLCRRGLL